jgi:hypothetical protein
MIRERLERIPDDDLELFGFNPESARPEWMVLQVLPVPPVYVRPSITLESGIRSEDDLTHKLVDKIWRQAPRRSSYKIYLSSSSITLQPISTTRLQEFPLPDTVREEPSKQYHSVLREKKEDSEATSPEKEWTFQRAPSSHPTPILT